MNTSAMTTTTATTTKVAKKKSTLKLKFTNNFKKFCSKVSNVFTSCLPKLRDEDYMDLTRDDDSVFLTRDPAQNDIYGMLVQQQEYHNQHEQQQQQQVDQLKEHKQILSKLTSTPSVESMESIASDSSYTPSEMSEYIRERKDSIACYESIRSISSSCISESIWAMKQHEYERQREELESYNLVTFEAHLLRIQLLSAASRCRHKVNLCHGIAEIQERERQERLQKARETLQKRLREQEFHDRFEAQAFSHGLFDFNR